MKLSLWDVASHRAMAQTGFMGESSVMDRIVVPFVSSENSWAQRKIKYERETSSLWEENDSSANTWVPPSERIWWPRWQKEGSHTSGESWTEDNGNDQPPGDKVISAGLVRTEGFRMDTRWFEVRPMATSVLKHCHLGKKGHINSVYFQWATSGPRWKS